METTTETGTLHLWDNNGEAWFAARDEDHLRELSTELYGFYEPDDWDRIDDEEEVMFWWYGIPKNVEHISARETDEHSNPDWTHEVHAKASAWANGVGPGLVASTQY